MEHMINDDLDNIFNHVSTGDRREGCDDTHIREYFKYFIVVAEKYKIYNCEIPRLIEDIKNINIKLLDTSFFILQTYRIYENELRELILENTDKLDKFIFGHIVTYCLSL
jgi:hypothetical protein